MEEVANRSLDVIRYSPHYQPLTRLSLLWFDVRVFYVRISNLLIDDSTPESLVVNHVPLDPDTLLEVNGLRSGVYSDGVGFQLRRDRADRKSEEATFVSTDSIRLTGSVKFEVLEKDELILSGVLEMCGTNGFIANGNSTVKRKWTMSCELGVGSVSGFSKKTESLPLTIEVYIAGCFLGSPIILTKTLQFSSRRKHTQRRLLDAIPENETECPDKDESFEHGLQVTEYHNKSEDEEYNYNYDNDIYWRTEYMEGEDGELSWFNAGVRVGVGIGLGICVGLGVGVGLLVRTYQSTTRNFRRRRLV